MFISIAVLWAACLCSAKADSNVTESAIPLAATVGYRLPLTILPTSYKLKLSPYLLESAPANKSFSFEGEVQIEILPKANTTFISLHSKNLQYSLKEYWLKTSPTQKQTFKSEFLNTTTDIWNLEVSEELTRNTAYILHFVYNGTMSDDMNGFYRSSYVNARNETKWLGSTHFQKINARRVFPCFDEPKFKAFFHLTLVHHKSLKTVSNTRIRSSSTDGDYITDVYKITPKMSTYLLAFVVSEFDERTNGNFTLLARSEFYEQTEYSFNFGQKSLPALEQYFDMNYVDLGIDKLHMAAIPDFKEGAMENWGLITYRERNLLYDENSTALSTKQYISTIVTHELTHMWFGNYVTCDWWSYTWLNEAFASYFQYFVTHVVQPFFELDKQFVVDEVQSVMYTDSTNSTVPMSVENTQTSAQIDNMFNAITYTKGASVLRMIAHTLGEANFQMSLKIYLAKYGKSTGKPQDLLDCLKNHWPMATKPHADAIFKSFTELVGYPVITVNLAKDGKSVEFSQKRFLLKNNEGSDTKLVYTVPISYTTSVDKDFSTTTPNFVLPSVGTHNETLSTAATWIITNIQETGYYRVNYNEENWHAIHEALLASNWSNIHELNRAQIVDDLFNLARAGEIRYDLALKVLKYLETELNYLPWASAFNGFSFLSVSLGNDNANFRKYIQKLTAKAYNKFGFEEKPNDSPLDIYLRQKILIWNCKYGNSNCISKAKKYFKTLNTKPVPKNIRSVIYCTALREGGSKEFDMLYSKLKTETIVSEISLIQNSFGCVRNQKLIERVFNMVLSSEIRSQDKATMLSKLFNQNSENVSPVFKLITDKFEQLAEAMDGYSPVAAVISNIASRFTTEEQERDLIVFSKKNSVKFGSSSATLMRAITNVRENLNWAEANLGEFKSHLVYNTSVGSGTISFPTTLSTALVAILFMLLL